MSAVIVPSTPEEIDWFETEWVRERERNIQEMEHEWTAESYAQTAIDDHKSIQEGYAA